MSLQNYFGKSNPHTVAYSNSLHWLLYQKMYVFHFLTITEYLYNEKYLAHNTTRVPTQP